MHELHEVHAVNKSSYEAFEKVNFGWLSGNFVLVWLSATLWR